MLVVSDAESLSGAFNLYSVIDIIHAFVSYDDIGNIESYTNIVVNLIVIVGGIVGLLFCKQLYDKYINATFSYLTRLQVRIKSLYDIYSKYKTPIMSRFIPEKERRMDVTPQTVFINEIIEDFAIIARDTLRFLEETNEQMPASKNWPEYYNLLLEFLGDIKYLSNENYHKWSQEDYEQQTEIYYNKHKQNLEDILFAIDSSQKRIIKRIFKEKNKDC